MDAESGFCLSMFLWLWRKEGRAVAPCSCCRRQMLLACAQSSVPSLYQWGCRQSSRPASSYLGVHTTASASAIVRTHSIPPINMTFILSYERIVQPSVFRSILILSWADSQDKGHLIKWAWAYHSGSQSQVYITVPWRACWALACWASSQSFWFSNSGVETWEFAFLRYSEAAACGPMTIYLLESPGMNDDTLLW